MTKKLTFTVPATLEGIAESKPVELELKRFHKLFKRGDIVPESIWIVANAMRADRAGALAFSTRLSYAECQKETLRRHPHLRLGATAFMRDREFSGIEFIKEELNNDAA